MEGIRLFEVKVILPRRTDTTRDAWCAGRTGEVQHQVTAGRCTGHSSSLLCTAVVHFPLWTLSDLHTVWLYNVHAHTQENQCLSCLKNQLWQQVSRGKQAPTTDIRLLITGRGTQPETVLCCYGWEQELKGGGSAERLPFSSGIHSIFPFLHRLMEETEREWKRGQCLGKRTLSNTGLVKALCFSFDNHLSFYCFLKCNRQCM